MYNQRLQIFLTTEQRRTLEVEAQTRSVSVAALIREAIDARFNTGDRSKRRVAFHELQRIAEQSDPTLLSPEELNRLIDESHTEEIERGVSGGSAR